MTVIELGLVTDGGDRPPSARSRRPIGRAELRRVLVAAVAIVCVLTVTGSARPEPHGPARLWSTPFREGADTFMVAGGGAYVLSQSGGTRLTAHDLRTGVVRWSNPVPDNADVLGLIQAGVLLLPAAHTTVRFKDPDGLEVYREFSRDTIAVDAVTGRQLWRRPGELAAATGDRALLTEWNDDGSRVRAMQMVRVADGGTVWSRRAADLETWVTDGRFQIRADRLVTASAKGDVEVFDLADGSPVSAATLPWGRPPAQDSRATALTVEGHRLYVEHSDQERTTVTAYDTETLRRLWHIEPRSPGGAFGCGPVLCLNGPDGTAGYDRDTGELRWRIPGSANAFPLVTGQLLVDDDESGARHHLIDAATGRRLADLGTAAPVWNLGTTASPYLLARTREPAGLMSVSRFDERSGEVLLLGAMPPVIEYGCQSEGTLLACMTQDSRLAVTDVG
ncbi:PQQ-binding-like beta-propeller repeat protein [Actinoplanes sp. NPDC049118]|uniref:outer membrane protein assembly factor BamB family protein n=1 Tax=Actinoplanes sp. NPDC049118 TaxID=3155769 RepID=UPI0033DF9D1B